MNLEILERVSLESWGKIVSMLAKRSGNIELAEDCLSVAFEEANSSWKSKGTPKNPEAWLMDVAKKRMIDHFRKAKRQQDYSRSERLEGAFQDHDSQFEDHRIGLIFACTHPAIDSKVRELLILQTIFKVSAERLSELYLVSPKAVSQRLVRAKRKIAEAGIRIEVPECEEKLESRLSLVLNSTYALLVLSSHASQIDSESFGSEARYLCDCLLKEFPENAELLGLAALADFHASRSKARLKVEYSPHAYQNLSNLDFELVSLGESKLMQASKIKKAGRFQIEAAIQSAQTNAAISGRTDHDSLCKLYDNLVCLSPTLGALVARAVAHAQKSGPEVGLKLLFEIEDSSKDSYQPYWSALGEIQLQSGRRQEAKKAFPSCCLAR